MRELSYNGTELVLWNTLPNFTAFCFTELEEFHCA